MIIELRFDYGSSFASVPDGYITNGKELQKSFHAWVEDQPENIIITKDGRAAVGYSDEDIIKYLKQYNLDNYTILVKGSRLMHMEDIVNFLKK